MQSKARAVLSPGRWGLMLRLFRSLFKRAGDMAGTANKTVDRLSKTAGGIPIATGVPHFGATRSRLLGVREHDRDQADGAAL